jgi:ubiquinone/menaquinone biosynthesis C-methylase UbiE
MFRFEESVMSVAQDHQPSPLTEKLEEGLVQQAIAHFRTASRIRRAALLCSLFELKPTTRILDLGGSDGVYLNSCLAGTPVSAKNVYIADISAAHVESAATRFGYTPVVVPDDGPLPFPDKFFDVVFCSSVLEHVTLPEKDAWLETSGTRFRRLAQRRQRQFANEINRIGAGYFVQVPYRWFPVETHTWLPFVAYLPRFIQCPFIGISNRFWIKATVPDFYLPTFGDMAGYFPDGEILSETVWGLTKSLIAVKRPSAA